MMSFCFWVRKIECGAQDKTGSAPLARQLSSASPHNRREVFDNRIQTKMLSIRISQEEFDALQSHHRAHGARNVSAFVRMAIAQMLAPPDDQLAEIRAKLALLDGKIDALGLAIEHGTPPAYQGLTCEGDNPCGHCARCVWERGRGLRS